MPIILLQEVETGGLRVQGQPELCNKTIPCFKTNRERNTSYRKVDEYVGETRLGRRVSQAASKIKSQTLLNPICFHKVDATSLGREERQWTVVTLGVTGEGLVLEKLCWCKATLVKMAWLPRPGD